MLSRGILFDSVVTPNREWRVPLGLFFLVFLLAALFSLAADPLPVTDEFLTYFRLATNISTGRGFTEDGAIPQMYLPPLFSMLLGGWFFLTGVRSLLAVQIYQSLCLGLTAVVAYLLYRKLFPGKRSAVAAGIWLAIHPSLWTYAVFVRQEPTILLTTTIACWATVRWLHAPGMGKAALAGAFWGVATLGKVVTFFFPILILGVWLLRRRKDWRVPGAHVVIAVAAFLMAIAPWSLRNWVVSHRFVLVNDQAVGILEWNVRHSDAPVDEGKGLTGLLGAQLKTKDPAKGELAGEKYIAELDRDGVEGKERAGRLWHYVLSHKKYFLVQRVRNAIFFAAPGVDWWIQSGRLKTGEAQRSAPFLLLALLFHGIFYLFFFWRLFLLARGELDLPMTFLVLFFALYWGTYALLWGEIRFSIPVYPVLILFAPWDRFFRPKGTLATDGQAIGTPRS